MNPFILLLQPLFGALTGWIIASLGIYLLFHPASPRRVFGVTLHGIIPGRQPQIAATLGKAAATGLFSKDDITRNLKGPDQIAALMPGIETHIDAFLKHRLAEKIPVLTMFLSDTMLQTIKEGLLEEIEAMLPDVIGRFTDSVQSKIDLEQLVSRKIAALPAAQLEGLVMGGGTRELRRVKLAATAVGFTIGLMGAALLACMSAFSV